MTEIELFLQMKRAIDAFTAKPSGEAFLDMQRSGLVDSKGGLQQWDAFLAIVATNATDSLNATHFRCRKPALGLPGGAEIVISRESMVHYLRAGKRIITAFRDEETGALREGEEVHLTSDNAIRTDASDFDSDNIGILPHFGQIQNRM